MTKLLSLNINTSILPMSQSERLPYVVEVEFRTDVMPEDETYILKLIKDFLGERNR